MLGVDGGVAKQSNAEISHRGLKLHLDVLLQREHIGGCLRKTKLNKATEQKKEYLLHRKKHLSEREVTALFCSRQLGIGFGNELLSLTVSLHNFTTARENHTKISACDDG